MIDLREVRKLFAGCVTHREAPANTGGMDQSLSGDGTACIVFGPEAYGLGPALSALCEIELAVDIQLRDGRALSGVLAEVVSEHLILRGFDDSSATHTDEMTLVPLADISRVEVP
jgi:hypothetical protein